MAFLVLLPTALYATGRHPVSTKSPQVNSEVWSRDVAPILFHHCVECHRPGQPAPFPLLSFDDAHRRAAQIAAVARSHFMPPWKPIAGFGDFAGARRLTPHEIAVIQSWASSGAHAGDLTRAPAAPVFPSTWQLGEPDAIAQLAEPVDVPADGPDQYRCITLPLVLDRDRYVRAFEFSSAGSAGIHHGLFFVDGRRSRGPDTNWECFGTPGFIPTAGLGGWTPGMGAVSMPPETAVHIPKGARLVMQLHLHPDGKPEKVDPQIALYFADHPPTRVLMDVGLGSNQIDIPAGQKSYQVRDSFTLPVPVQVVGIIPHAHYVCKDMKAWAILPGGRKRWLLWIADWDFNWQSQFRYRTPFMLPAGTRLEMLFTYDNSAENVRNPNHPPQRVQYGPGSTDEMAGIHLQVIPKDEADMHELGMAQWGKFMRSRGGEFYHPEQ
jgi:hypothetical protein